MELCGHWLNLANGDVASMGDEVTVRIGQSHRITRTLRSTTIDRILDDSILCKLRATTCLLLG